MLTLKDLSEYDIKNIDVQRIKQYFVYRKDILANIIVILIFIIATGKVIERRRMETTSLLSEINSLKEKSAAIFDYENARNKVRNYVAALPKGLSEAGSIIDKINDLAILHNIQITSFSPAKTDTTDYFNIIRMKLNISSFSYKDIGQFIFDIENSGNNLRVDNWSTSFNKKRRNNRSVLTKQKIDVSIEIASVKFKETK